MRFEQLRGFTAVARLGSFTKAADELFLAQPSLSRQIATLEAELGAELFHRSRGGAGLSPAGEALLPLARRMLADEETARREIAAFAGLDRGRVRLGATPTLCVSLVAEVLRVFHDAHPGIELHLSEAGSRRLVEQLDEGELDLALVVTGRAGAQLPASTERTPLLTEELVVVSAATRPHATAPHDYTLSELATVPQIVFGQGYDLRAATDAAYREAGLTPAVAVEGAEMDAVLRFVERGVGVAVVPAMVLLDRPALRADRLVAPTLTRTVSLARRTDVRESAAVAAMVRAVVEAVGDLTAPGTELARLVAAVPRR